MAALEIKKQTGGYFRFILDGDGDNAIIDNAPNATSFGDVFNFKTKNGANIIQKQFIRYDEITYIDIVDVSTTFLSVDEVWLKLIDEEFFLGLNQSGSGFGADRFDELVDTFSYIGNDGKVPVVDQTNLKLIPVAFYNFKDFIQLQDVSIPSLIEGKYVTVADVSGTLKVVLSDPPEVPEQLANSVGFFNIADLTTQTTPINYTTGTIVLTNDGAGAGSTSLYRPFGVASIWNSLTNRFDFNSLSLGDEILLRIDLKITTSVANQVVNINMVIGEGTADELTFRVADKYYKNTVTDEPLTAAVPFFIGTELRRTAPGKLTFSSVGNDDVTIKVGSFFPTIIRKGVNIVTIEAEGDLEAAHYKGEFNATTGVVTGGGTLANGLGDVGDFYKVSVAGTYNFGAGGIEFAVNDFVIYNNVGNVYELFINNRGSVTQTTITTTSSSLSTQDLAGFLTYVNAVTAFFIAKNEEVTYHITDTGQQFQIRANNRMVGSGQTALTSSNVIESKARGGARSVWIDYGIISGVSVSSSTLRTPVKTVNLPIEYLKDGFIRIEFMGSRVINTLGTCIVECFINSSPVVAGAVASSMVTLSAASNQATGLPFRRSIVFNPTTISTLANVSSVDDTGTGNNVRVILVTASMVTNHYLIFTYTNAQSDMVSTPISYTIEIFN